MPGFGPLAAAPIAATPETGARLAIVLDDTTIAATAFAKVAHASLAATLAPVSADIAGLAPATGRLTQTIGPARLAASEGSLSRAALSVSLGQVELSAAVITFPARAIFFQCGSGQCGRDPLGMATAAYETPQPECPGPPGPPTPFSDPLTAPTGDALLPSILATTPRGAAWRTDWVADADNNSFQHRFWRAVADPVADLYAKAWKLALASTACTLSGPEDPLNDSLEDWETEYGLPDPCAGGLSQSVDQRKTNLRVRVAEIGGQSAAYFECLALSLGYTIEISDFRVFRCGDPQSRCGQTQIGGPLNECFWRVSVGVPPFDFFRCGAGECGRDPLGSVGPVVPPLTFFRCGDSATRIGGTPLGRLGPYPDLECSLNEWKPAHTQIAFAYTLSGA